jgi:putative transposase
LTPLEREQVVSVLHADRFVDKAPAEIQATLLDEGRYLCSVRTMYRLLRQRREVRERRNQRRHPPYVKPELLATRPNQVWSWDITKLRGPNHTHFSLYVVIDIFSRYVVAWLVAERESAELAEQLLRHAWEKEAIARDSLTIHSDRGSPMTSKPVAYLLADLGVTKTVSRPHVSDDNPYSEAQFKTLKYRPDFPERFGSIFDARAFCRRFFGWYNSEHRHSGIAMLTPLSVHAGLAAKVLEQRQHVLTRAYEQHPERFVRSAPRPLPLPAEAWINEPKPEPAEAALVL